MAALAIFPAHQPFLPLWTQEIRSEAGYKTFFRSLLARLWPSCGIAERIRQAFEQRGWDFHVLLA
jgi:hypothetical protein